MRWGVVRFVRQRNPVEEGVVMGRKMAHQSSRKYYQYNWRNIDLEEKEGEKGS